MNFADNVRNNYTPIPTPKKDPNICKKVAEEQMNFVKNGLMSCAKAGSVKGHPNDFLAAMGKKVVSVSVQVHVSPHNRQVRSRTWDGEMCPDIEVPNTIKMHMVYNEMVRLCRKEGINVKLRHDLVTLEPYFDFWIDV